MDSKHGDVALSLSLGAESELLSARLSKNVTSNGFFSVNLPVDFRKSPLHIASMRAFLSKPLFMSYTCAGAVSLTQSLRCL